MLVHFSATASAIKKTDAWDQTLSNRVKKLSGYEYVEVDHTYDLHCFHKENTYKLIYKSGSKSVQHKSEMLNILQIF